MASSLSQGKVIVSKSHQTFVVKIYVVFIVNEKKKRSGTTFMEMSCNKSDLFHVNGQTGKQKSRMKL